LLNPNKANNTRNIGNAETKPKASIEIHMTVIPTANSDFWLYFTLKPLSNSPITTEPVSATERTIPITPTSSPNMSAISVMNRLSSMIGKLDKTIDNMNAGIVSIFEDFGSINPIIPSSIDK
jgi:hypothetical protein